MENAQTSHLGEHQTLVPKVQAQAEIAPYLFYRHATQQLDGLAPVDFYLAKEMMHLFSRDENVLNSHQREQAFHLIVKLSEFLRLGHSCLPIAKIANKTHWHQVDTQGFVTHQGFTFDAEPLLVDILSCTELNYDQTKPLVFNDGKLFLRRYFEFEQLVNTYMQDNEEQNASSLKQSSIQKITEAINTLFPQEANTQSPDWQKIAVANALNKQFSIIAGGPGTGKTYTVTKLLAALVMLNKDNPLTIALTAPTGKAAQRLSESILAAKEGFKGLVAPDVLDKIPTTAQTLHRLLGVIPNSPRFKHHKDNLLSIDVLLIDEVSMVDLPMMARLIDAIPDHTKVILLGDAQQLPSVAAGSVLADLTPYPIAKYSTENRQYLQTVTNEKLPSSGKQHTDHVTFLTYSRRFAGDGGIGNLAKHIINGDAQSSWQLLQNESVKQDSELTFNSVDNFEQAIRYACQQYRQVSNASSLSEAFEKLSAYRILVAMRKGALGVESLNALIEQELSPSWRRQGEYYQGKPLMITANDYHLGLFNGDIGIVWPNAQGQLYVYFEAEGGNLKSFMPSRLPSHETVYAMTIHKTQGSEFHHVELMLPKDAMNQMLTRELIYTGVTRAKKKLSVMAEKSQWFQAVENKVERFSGIKVKHT